MISSASSNLLIQIQIIEREKRERERQKEIEECRRWDESIYGKFKMNSKRKLGYITLIL
jgi:phosphoribosylaminoimidazole carboxylase (NCAIR synthetase)